jgi:hypothetical protein
MLVVFSIAFIGCDKPDFPKFPDIKHEYFLTVENGKYVCIQFDIKSIKPYEIGNPTPVDFHVCDGLSGWLIEDKIKLLNFTDDAQDWAKKYKDCKP